MRLDDWSRSEPDEIEVFDRTMALRMAAVASNPIAIDTVECWWDDVEREAAEADISMAIVSQWPGDAVEGDSARRAIFALARVADGETCLRTPDGATWVMSTTLIAHNEFGPGDNRYLQRLWALLICHNWGPTASTSASRRSCCAATRSTCGLFTAQAASRGAISKPMRKRSQLHNRGRDCHHAHDNRVPPSPETHARLSWC